jgi:hypothetical protein
MSLKGFGEDIDKLSLDLPRLAGSDQLALIRAQSSGSPAAPFDGTLSARLSGAELGLRISSRSFTHTRAQEFPAGECGNQAYEVFLLRRPKTVARKLTNGAGAFFPRYLFIRVDLTRYHWHSVNGTFGVSRLVMQGELPDAVPRGIVAQ